MDRTFWLICLCGTVIAGSFAIQIGAMPAWLADRGVSSALTGAVMMAYPAGVVLCRLSGPIWLDRGSWRLPILMGCAIAAAGSALLLFAQTWQLLAVARVFVGIGFAAVAATTVGAIGHRSAPERRGTQLGIYYGLNGVVLVSAPPAGLLLLHLGGFRAVAMFALACALVAGAFGAAIGEGPRQITQDRAYSWSASQYLLIAAGALCAVPLGALEATLPYVARAWGVGMLGALYLAWGIGMLLGRIGGGAIGDRLDRRKVVAAGLAIAFASQLAAAWLGSAAGLFANALIGGAALGVVSNAITTLLSLSTRPDAQARTLSWFILFYNLAFAAAAGAGGLSFAIGPAMPFLLSAAAILAAAGVLSGVASAVPSPTGGAQQA